MTFALFHSQNRISSKQGINHWIPFTENEVNSREKFDSNFITDFVSGKIQKQNSDDLLAEIEEIQNNLPLEFSLEAKAVFEAGLEFWKYYHKEPNCNVNASLYDIKAYFQRVDDSGRMKNRSLDAKYNLLIGNLRQNLEVLSLKIQPKVYEFGFLK